MADDRLPSWAKDVLELAKREGVRIDDPKSVADFVQRYSAEVARQAEAKRAADKLGGVEPWQMRELQQVLLIPLWTRMASLLGAPPRFALGIVVVTTGDDPHVGYATDHNVEFRAVFKDGSNADEGFARRIAELGGGAVPAIAHVKPLLADGAYFLSICSPPLSTPQLLAWDIRPLLATASTTSIDKLRRFVERTGVPNARLRRRAQLHRLSDDERLEVLRDAAVWDISEPGVRRMPLHGILQSGHPVREIDAADGTVQPYRFLKFVDRLLEQRLVVPYQQGRAISLDTSLPASGPARGHQKDADGVRRQPAVELVPNHRDVAQDIDDARRLIEQHLTGKELAAALLYLDAEYAGKTPQQYCETLGRPYGAVKKAHARAIARLKKIVAEEG